MHGEEIALGPGKTDLLAAIERVGSISGAARELGMSYRRAWLLVETMNRCFKEPLVITLAGGRHGGGAHLSELGIQVMRIYLNAQQRAQQQAEEDLAAL